MAAFAGLETGFFAFDVFDGVGHGDLVVRPAIAVGEVLLEMLDGGHVGVEIVFGEGRAERLQLEGRGPVGGGDLEVRRDELGVGARGGQEEQIAQENHLCFEIPVLTWRPVRRVFSGYQSGRAAGQC